MTGRRMKVFTGEVFADRRITDVIVPSDEAHRSTRQVCVMVAAVSKSDAMLAVNSCLRRIGDPGWLAEYLRMHPASRPPTAMRALVESGLYIDSAPGCWFYLDLVDTRIIAKAGAETVEAVGTFSYDPATSKMSLVPIR